MKVKAKRKERRRRIMQDESKMERKRSSSGLN